MQDQSEHGATPDPRRWVAFAVLLTANFMNLIDVTIVNVALPTMETELGASPNQIEWIVAAYIFVFALLLLPSGRAGDIFGRRRMFILGVSLFTTASAICGLAPTVEWLIAARVLQGIGGAMMTPQTLALVPFLFPPAERGGVFGLFALAAGLASVTGPLLGGILIAGDFAGLSWRPIFLVNIPVGILTVFLALRLVPPAPGRRALGIDWGGIALAGITLLAVLVPLVEGPSIGWSAPLIALLLAAPFAGWLFVLWEHRQARRAAPQLLPFDLLRKRSFLTGTILSATLFSGIPGFFLVVALYLQAGYGLTPLQSGLTTLPFSLGVLVASPVASRLGANHLRRRIIVGSALMAAALLALHWVILGMGGEILWSRTAPLFLVAGFGLGTTVSPLFQIALSGVSGPDSGSASGAVQAVQQVGSAFGVAIMGGLFFSTLGTALPGDKAAYADAAVTAFLYATFVFGIIAVAALATRIGPESERNLATP